MAAGKSVATCLDLPAYVCIQRTWPSQLQVCSDKHVVAHRAGSKKQAREWETCGAPLSRPRAYHSRLGWGSHTSQATRTHSSAASSFLPPFALPSPPLDGCLPQDQCPMTTCHPRQSEVRKESGAGGCVGRRLCAVFGSLARHGEGRRSACSVGGKQEDWSPLRPGGDASYPLHSLLSMSTVCGA